MRSHKSKKDKQYNGQKITKGTNNDLRYTAQENEQATRTPF